MIHSLVKNHFFFLLALLACHVSWAVLVQAQSFQCSHSPSSGSSPVWEYAGGTGETTVGTTMALIGDVNNDSVKDVAIQGRYSGSLLWYVAVVSGANGSELYRVDGSSSTDFFGAAIASISDVNSDGVEDFVVGAPGDCTSCQAGTVKIFSGKFTSGGTNGVVIDTITQTSGTYLGIDIVPLSDIAGSDGIVEFAVSSQDSSGDLIVEIYNGSTRATVFTITDNDYLDVGSLHRLYRTRFDYDDDGNLDLLLVWLSTTFATPNYTYFPSVAVLSGVNGQLLNEVCVPESTGSYDPPTFSGCEDDVAGLVDALISSDIDSHSGKDFVFNINGNGGNSISIIAAISSDNSVLWAQDTYETGYSVWALDLAQDYTLDSVPEFLAGFRPNPASGNLGYASIYKTSNSGPTELGSFTDPGAVQLLSNFGVDVLLGPDANGDEINEVLVSDPIDQNNSKHGSVRLFNSACKKLNFEAWMYPVVIDGC